MLGRGAIAKFRPAPRQGVHRGGSSQLPEKLHQSFMSTPDAQADHGVDDVGREAASPEAQRERHGSSDGYLGYLLCAAGRQDLLTTRHLRDRLPPEMPPLC